MAIHVSYHVRRIVIVILVRKLGNLAEFAVESNTDEIAARPLDLKHFSEVSLTHDLAPF